MPEPTPAAEPVSPTPETPPAQPTSVPPTPVPPTPDATVPPLKRDTPIQTVDKNGNPITPTVGEMDEVYRNRPSEDDWNNFNVFKDAMDKNDPVAQRKLFEKYQPPLPEPEVPKTPEGEQIAALTAKVDELQTTLGRVAPIVDGISGEAETHQIRSAIQAKATEYPFLAKSTKGADMVKGRVDAIKTHAKKLGHDMTKIHPEVITKMYEKVFTEVNNFLKETVAELGGTPTATPPASPGVTVVNDQTQPVPSGQPGGQTTPPRWQQKAPGSFVDTTVPQAAAPLEPAVPATPVTPPTGTPVGLNVEAQPEGPMTPETMQEQMRLRRQKLEGII